MKRWCGASRAAAPTAKSPPTPTALRGRYGDRRLPAPEPGFLKIVIPAKAGIHFSTSRKLKGGSRPSPGRQLSIQIDPDGYCGGGDDCGIAAVIIGDVEPAFDGFDRHLAMRQCGLDRRELHPRGLLHADRHLDLHRFCIDAEAADQGQRAVMDRVLHRAHRRLGVIAAMQIVAGAEFGDDPPQTHGRRSGMSSRTTAAALATTVLFVPSSLTI